MYQIQFSEIMHATAITPFKDFGSNRKLIYDFLLVVNTNLPLILHRFQVMADYWSNFR